MSLRSPTHTMAIYRPEVLEDQDPYEAAAEELGDPILTGVAGNVWFPRAEQVEASDQDQVLTGRVLLDPTPDVELGKGDILEDQEGERYRLTWATRRFGVPGLEHTAGGVVQVARRPVAEV